MKILIKAIFAFILINESIVLADTNELSKQISDWRVRLNSKNASERLEAVSEVFNGKLKYDLTVGGLLVERYKIETEDGIRYVLLATLHFKKHPSAKTLIEEAKKSSKASDREIGKAVESGDYLEPAVSRDPAIFPKDIKEKFNRIETLNDEDLIEVLRFIYDGALPYDAKLGNLLVDKYKSKSADLLACTWILLVLDKNKNPNFASLLEEARKSEDSEERDLLGLFEQSKK